jgi:hypothetical protein
MRTAVVAVLPERRNTTTANRVSPGNGRASCWWNAYGAELTRYGDCWNMMLIAFWTFVCEMLS